MNLIERVKNILVSPANEWQVIKNENLSIQEIFTSYVLILAAIPVIAGFIGQTLIGVSVPFFGTFRYPIGTGILYAVLQYVLSVAGVYALALIIDALAPSFGASKDLVTSLKVVAFSYTASWVVGILSIIPALGMLAVIGSIYSLVLLYMGMKALKEPPQDKLVGYYVVTLIVSIILFAVIGFIVSAIALSGFTYNALQP